MDGSNQLPFTCRNLVQCVMRPLSHGVTISWCGLRYQTAPKDTLPRVPRGSSTATRVISFCSTGESLAWRNGHVGPYIRTNKR